MRKVKLTETFKFAYGGCVVKVLEKGSILNEDDPAAVLALEEDRGEYVTEDAVPLPDEDDEGGEGDEGDEDDEDDEDDEVVNDKQVKKVTVNESGNRKRRK